MKHQYEFVVLNAHASCGDRLCHLFGEIRILLFSQLVLAHYPMISTHLVLWVICFGNIMCFVELFSFNMTALELSALGGQARNNL